jgi:hypothetical protein
MEDTDMDMAEVDVEVIAQKRKAVKVSNGDIEVWVPYSLIDADSEINEDSEPDEVGVLIIPQWKAEELELV